MLMLSKHRASRLLWGAMAIATILALHMPGSAAEPADTAGRPLIVQFADGVDGSSPEVTALFQQARAVRTTKIQTRSDSSPSLRLAY